MNSSNIALLQMCSTADFDTNLQQIEQQLQQLHKSVKLVLTPENALLFSGAEAYRQFAETEGQGPVQQRLSELSRQYGIWLLVGSMPLISRDNPQKMTTSSLLFDDKGELKARYDKLHLFDVEIADKHRQYRESDTYQHGERLCVVETPVGKLGLTMCYDLRFPGLFQALRDKGAELISVPAAFTRVTGEAHWEILLRARAIETQCFILATAQTGEHSLSRQTWGHSMVISPWGEVIAENPDRIAPLHANIASDELYKLRARMPVAQHNRFQSTLMKLSK